MVNKLPDSPPPLAAQTPSLSHPWCSIVLHFESLGSFKNPNATPHPRPIKPKALGTDPGTSIFLKLPRWFKYVAKVENYCPSRKRWNKIPADLHLWFHPDSVLHSVTKPFCQRCEHAMSPSSPPPQWVAQWVLFHGVYNSAKVFLSILTPRLVMDRSLRKLEDYKMLFYILHLNFTS